MNAIFYVYFLFIKNSDIKKRLIDNAEEKKQDSKGQTINPGESQGSSGGCCGN